MTTYYLRDHKERMIGKVEVNGSKVTVHSINKRTKLKTWVKIALAFIAGAALMLAVQAWSERSERWYQECDAHYGYTTDYYTCRLYHIRGGE